jgi:hypothetical protein
MARYLWFRQMTRPAPASLVLAWLVLLAPLGIPGTRSQTLIAQTSGASVGMCEFTAQGKYYVSAIFDAANDNDRSKWEVAWVNYIHDKVDKFPGNSYCRFFPSRAGAQQTLQIRKNQLGAAKVIETGWVYTGGP